jgi:hypothetical protein
MKSFLSISLLSVAVAVWGAPSSQEVFGRAQSTLEAFQGAPLISANWEGRFRPYLYTEGKFNPLFPAELSNQYPQTDFLNPKPLNDSQFLIYAETLGQANSDLLVFDDSSKKIQKISYTAHTEPGWYDHSCVSRDNNLISMPTKTGQAFFKLDFTRLSADPIDAGGSAPAFSHCLWVNPTTLLGLSKNNKLYHCEFGNESASCQATLALTGFVSTSQFFQDKSGRPGVIGIQKGETFKQAYVLSKDYTKATLLKTPMKLMGDILDVQQGHFRVGLHGRFVTDLTRDPAPKDIISRFKKIGDTWYAIATNAQYPRTLAVLEKEAWKFLPYHPPVSSSIQTPVEVITKSATGKHYQSFLYGPATNKKVVVWLHGGPHESFSPRFHPYIYSLNEKGYSVLAVNYPGSTGRGLAYSQATSSHYHLDCMQSIAQYLKENQAEEIVVWSVSYGDKLQKDMLEHDFPISKVVDQVGVLPKGVLKQLAQEKSVPYFSIRGKYDTLSSAEGADFVYEGAHDLTYYQDFERLMGMFM